MGKIGPRLLLMTNSKSIRAFNWCQNQRPWMTLKDHYAVFQNTCFFRSPSRKFEWRETHTISDEDVAQWLVSGNVGFVRIFAGVPWRGSVKRHGVIENIDFQGFRTLHLRHLRKWGQLYCKVLFSPLSTFHWPQNTWPWVTLTGHFTLFFYCYEQHFQNLFYVLTVEPICRIFLSYHVTIRDVRKRTVIRRIVGICWSTADLSQMKSCGRYYLYRRKILTNKANNIT